MEEFCAAVFIDFLMSTITSDIVFLLIWFESYFPYYITFLNQSSFSPLKKERSYENMNNIERNNIQVYCNDNQLLLARVI